MSENKYHAIISTTFSEKNKAILLNLGWEVLKEIDVGMTMINGKRMFKTDKLKGYLLIIYNKKESSDKKK